MESGSENLVALRRLNEKSCDDKDEIHNQEAMTMMDPMAITESTAVAALIHIYGPNGADKLNCDISAEKKARERKIGKCPNCKRVIRYPDIEDWESVRYFNPLVYISAPIYRKSGNCPDCGQAITVQGMGSCLYGMPFSRYHWEMVIEGRPTTFELLFNGPSGWLGGIKTLFRLLLRR